MTLGEGYEDERRRRRRRRKSTDDAISYFGQLEQLKSPFVHNKDISFS